MAAIGIDLGTTNSCVAVFKKNKIQIAYNSSGKSTTPSYVLFTDDGTVIGNDAKTRIASSPENTVYNVKRFIGLDFMNPTVTSDRQNLTFKVVQDNGKPVISVKLEGEERLFSPVEVSGFILGELKKTAEAWLGNEAVTEAVISVPARFNGSQRQATIEAAKLAGLKVLQLINEPTAAAVAFGLSKNIIMVNRVLIYDLGGGTFDVTLVEMKVGNIRILSTGGDIHLGGEDFDTHIVNHYISEFKRKHRKDISRTPRAVSRLRAQCERAKCSLSFRATANVYVDCLHDGIDLNETLTRVRFEELNTDLFNRTLIQVEGVLKDATMKREDIDHIILVGGSTRIPKVRELLTDYFNGKDLNTSVHPDEAIALGAAAQAAMLKKYELDGVEQFLLEDVVPRSLGYNVMGDMMTVVIERYTPIPTKQTMVNTTAKVNRTKAHYRIYEGERKRASANTLLGEFKLSGIPSAPKGVANIDVTFDIDRNGILTVSAVCRGVGERKEITVTEYRGQPTTASIEDKVGVTRDYKAEDEEHVRRGAVLKALNYYAYEMRTKVNETIVESKLSASDRENVTKKCNEVIKWVQRVSNDLSVTKEDIKSRQKELESICKPIMRKL